MLQDMQNHRPTSQGTPIHIPGQMPAKDAAEPDTATSIGHRFEGLSLGSDLPGSSRTHYGDTADTDSASTSRRNSDPEPTLALTMDSPLQLDDLNNEHRRRCIDAMDQLRDLGVNEDISLPQLVVVGDQSSGKSSLLEGLTGLAFPIASDVCTRFATRFVTRRTQGPPMLRATIKPGPRSRNDQRSIERLTSFQRVFGRDALGNRIEMEALFKEVAERMGLPQDVESSPARRGKRFSDDMLEIEFNGPGHSDISVIDLPGLFHTATRYQTSADLQLIRETIDEYIQDENTIILAIMNANNNLANQEVFDMASRKDPHGVRTIGVMTKCDTIQAGDEHSVLKVAQNGVKKLHHGWFVVRNRSTREIEEGVTIPERHEREEAFFSTGMWGTLERSRCGVKALMAYLSDVLHEHIQTQLPRISTAVRQLHAKACQEVKDMGDTRQTPSEQRQYLMRFAQGYERLLIDSLSGHYRSDVPESSALRLETYLHSLKKSFRTKMYASGHTWAFMNFDNTLDALYTADVKISITATDNANLPGLGNSAIYHWIYRNYENSSSTELPGTVDPNLVKALFHQQTENWVRISQDYLNDIGEVLRKYTVAAHERLLGEVYSRIILLGKHKAYLETILGEASRELSKLLADERESKLSTANTAFTQRIVADRRERVIARFRALGANEQLLSASSAQPATVTDVQTLIDADRPRWEEQVVFDIHDTLKAFYEVARERFMDSIWMAVVKRNLTGEADKMMRFKSDYILALSDEELAELASEHPDLAKKRRELKERRERYEGAVRIIEDLR